MIFEITAKQIAALTDADLRKLIGSLVEQEVIKEGHSTSAVTYGGDQNAADGGIDVRAQLPRRAQLKGYVPRAATGFQVKAEKMPRNKILKEMCPDGHLREAIKQLGHNGGAYIIVSSKESVADTALSARQNAMAEAIAGEPTAAQLRLDFYDQQRIATWVNQNPGLVPWIRERIGEPLSGWRPYGDWSSSPQPVDAEYMVDDRVRLISANLGNSGGLSATDGINALRVTVGSPGEIIRLVGLSGVGKTRFVQALFDDRIGQNAIDPRLAVYTDISDEPDPVPLELLGRLLSLGQRCVLIVDNCGSDLHRRLGSGLIVATR